MPSASATSEQPLPHVPLEDVLQRVESISTLPHVALHVMRLANDPNIAARDLKRALESDPALSARVLRCVNSSSYALRSKVANLQQAISLLGFNQVRNLAITTSISQSFNLDTTIGAYSSAQLWRHMVAVAICARLIATRCKLLNFEDAFLAGLLHDIGIVVAEQHLHREFAAAMRSLDERRPLVEVERQFLGFDHTQMGARLAGMWKFPPAVQDAIRFHHDSDAYCGEHGGVVHTVAVANLVCTLKDISSVGLKLVTLPRTSLTVLALDKDDLKLLVTDLDHEIEANHALFAC